MELNSRHTALIGAATSALAAAAVVSGVSAARAPATAPGIVVEAHTALSGQPVDGSDGLAVHDHMALRPEGLRQDRILDGASAAGDPLKLMRLFRITEATAMRYVGAACPERTAKLSR
ncbi:hypothetical protein ACFZCK_03190 [Kitasatospora purpeofusca]|uniref:hypothetical protein n=1 Tax=Kitasatospora purpeofusca TaxID=67352 RepID=UPI0036EA91AC